MGRAFTTVLVRDLTLALRRRSELANPLVFFLVVVTLFPLALGPEKDVLSRVAPGVLWVAALLASTMAMESVFRSDFEDGALEQLLLSPQPPSVLVLAKIVAHWLVTGLPLLVASPVLALLLHLPGQALPTLLASLALGTPVLSLVGAIGVALTVGLRRGGLLMTLLVLPLYVPVLIFGAGAVDNATAGLPVAGQLYFLAAVLVLAVTLAPMAAAAALRISLG